MVEACAAAFAATGDPLWIDHAERAYAWFLGANDVACARARVDGADRRMHDGLTATGPNLIRGAAIGAGISRLSRRRLRKRRCRRSFSATAEGALRRG